MEGVKVLFGTDIGILSMVVIAVVIGMSVFFVRFFNKKMDENPAD